MFYYSTKTIELGSCAFRQPYANSHCKFLHGYRLTAKFIFGCSKLDQNNWVVDFGGIKELKSILEQQFDHTTVVWSKDPQIELFRTLNERGVVDLRVMEDGVGIEKFAEYCFEVANKYIKELSNSRCWVESVEVWEHEKNSGIVKNTIPVQSLLCETKDTAETIKLETIIPTKTVPVTETKPVQEAPKTAKREPIPAPVGNKIDKQNNLSFKSALDGLKWGSKQ